MNNATQKNMTKEENKIYEEKYFMPILKKYEMQMLCNQKEKSIFIQKYFNKKDINLLTEEVYTNYLKNDLNKYISEIFQKIRKFLIQNIIKKLKN